jgi:hypothetical protein
MQDLIILAGSMETVGEVEWCGVSPVARRRPCSRRACWPRNRECRRGVTNGVCGKKVGRERNLCVSDGKDGWCRGKMH